MDVEVDGKEVELTLWDTAGTDDYDRLRPLAYPESHVILITFAVDSPDSFENIQEKWIREVQKFCHGVPFILLGCKRELRTDPTTIKELKKKHLRPVSTEEAMMVASKIGAELYLECSGMTGEGLRETVQHACRLALVKPPFFKQRLNLSFSSAGVGVELQNLLNLTAASRSLKTFRLLIIGKTGCGKTTILTQVCGGNMVDAPSTTHGVHNIENEIKFESNPSIVAHDSEGFEAGAEKEFETVMKFIQKRADSKDINEKIHLIWYCTEMSARPIQKAEELFFSTSWKIPIVAIITKFDEKVQSIQRNLERDAGIDEDDFEDFEERFKDDANQQAKILLEVKYEAPLKKLKHPPKAVVPVSNAHLVDSSDSPLKHLVEESKKALSINPLSKQYDLRTFFSVAQKADTQVKLCMAVENGLLWNFDRKALPMYRKGMFMWGDWAPAKVAALEKVLDNSSRLVGQPLSSRPSKAKESSTSIELARWDQIIADTAIILEKAFIFQIKDPNAFTRLVEWYEKSKSAQYVKEEVLNLCRKREKDKFDLPHSWTIEFSKPLAEIVTRRPFEEFKWD